MFSSKLIVFPSLRTALRFQDNQFEIEGLEPPVTVKVQPLPFQTKFTIISSKVEEVIFILRGK
jgi:hypothetical protein